jgi:amino acid transporter
MEKLSGNIKSIIALLVVIMTYAIFFIVLFRYATDNNAVSQVIIAVVSALSAILGYFFGYSQGAAKKDETIANLGANVQSDQTPNTQTPQEPAQG